MAQYLVPVKRHADGDEKQPQQQIVKRANFGFNVLLVGRFGNQHARNKCAQRKAQACLLGNPCQPERNQQQVKHKQLLAAKARNYGEPKFHQPLPACEQQCHYSGSFEHGQQQGFGHVVVVGA